MAAVIPRRWVAVGVFMLASSVSFLDRQLLAALAPSIEAEYGLSSQQYGLLVSSFYLIYGLGAPFAGILIDRIGLNAGISVSLISWSLAGIATGFTGSFATLLGCRAWLGLAESANIPANGKAVALYLKPAERSLGTASGQVAISIGMVSAPVIAGALASGYGWRAAFIVTGLAGFLWIPLWLWLSKRIPPDTAARAASSGSAPPIFTDWRLWALVSANVLGMSTYSLWVNWTTKVLVATYGLTQEDANLRLAWLPPVFAALGGVTGGVISMRFYKAGVGLADARIRAALLGGLALLVTAAVPYLPNATLGTAAMCWSFFWSAGFSANLYALPLDYFGAARAGSAIGALTFAYGMLSTFSPPLIGAVVDRHGYGPVCAVFSVLPLGAWAILRISARAER